MTDQPNATAVDESRTVPCPEYRCGAPAGEACLRLDGTRSTVSHARRWRAYDRARQAHAKSAPAPMTPVPDYVAGARALLAATSDCTIDGEPAVVVRVAELNDLTARVHRAEAAAPTELGTSAANANATTRHVGTSTIGEPATAGRATVTVTVSAPDQDNADQWAGTIRDLVQAEHGHHMRLDITIGDGEAGQ